LSHGDTKHILLFPNSVAECYEFAGEAFNLAERLQTPVFVMSDLDLGMNNWMSEPFTYPEKPMDRGKILSKQDLERLGSFARYRDVDGDGIGWRTLPGTDHPAAAYFARGTGHNEKAEYSERPDDWEKNMNRLLKKFETARQYVPAPVIEGNGDGIGILAYGTTHWAIVECRDQLRQEHGIDPDYLRVRAFPFTYAVEDFIRRHSRVYVVEQNRDRQLFNLLRLELPAELAPKLRSIAHLHGLPVDARSITDEIMQKENL
jgi:2-oxoglutarate ferredoxin oxidoreductase subunit alpha